MKAGYKESAKIADVTQQIVAMLDPVKIYLYNQRLSSEGHTSSFKVCVILRTGERSAAERQIYLNIDCEVPFDVLLYTAEEWDELSAQPDTFAHKILQTGAVLYG